MNGLQARFAARRETAMHLAETRGDLARLDALLTDAVRTLGSEDPVTFLIACGAEEYRSLSRPIAESVRAWSALQASAERVLPPDDAGLMTIRSFRIRYSRRKGGPGDLDNGVTLYRAEWEFRAKTFGVGHLRTRTTLTNYALALRDRGGPEDLEQALRILREEMESRECAFGPRHPATWSAQAILAQTLVLAAEHDGSLPADPSEALGLATSIGRLRGEELGLADTATLQANLVKAHALLALGLPAKARAEVEEVICRTRGAPHRLEPGWPEFLLARAQAAIGDPAALGTAHAALRRRIGHLPPAASPVADARRLVESLSQ